MTQPSQPAAAGQPAGQIASQIGDPGTVLTTDEVRRFVVDGATPATRATPSMVTACLRGGKAGVASGSMPVTYRPAISLATPCRARSEQLTATDCPRWYPHG